MSDRFTCLSLEQLLHWIKREETTNKIFGIPKALFFNPTEDDVFKTNRYGRILETPVGVAAGPHTQLSQNIVSSWLTGARYIELKTIQVLDELEVTKPCINMEDEGYNCEWSQELKLEQSLDEYINAFIAIYILKKKLNPLQLQRDNDPGFIFNMSVGYNLEGILSPAVQKFLDSMANARELIDEKLTIAQTIFPEAADIDIPSCVSDNVTISTMHGCPPHEIEKIGLYFIEQRKLNTTIKLNPTLLGPKELREILNNRLGFDVIVPDIAFEHDLKYDAGVKLINNLLQKAKASNVEFNIKLTNTLEIQNAKSLLPEKEPMLYMSGRALHAISINLASKLQNEFNGNLDISFSAGADCFNIANILSCGLTPVTICSDLLKPGGYGRIAQYLSSIQTAFARENAASISEYIGEIAVNNGNKKKNNNEKEAVLANLMAYAQTVKNDRHYQKKTFPWSTIKTDRELDLFDCIHAPCKGTCPTGQDVPSYMYYTAKGMFEEAFKTILETNPFPNVQGMVCDHPCTGKCTRINYDTPLQIREIKRFVAQNSPEIPELIPLEDNHLKAAIIGGGPSGFSAAYFLRMNGFDVDIFEAKDFAGGMAADAIPSFRLDDFSIQKDINRIISLGVRVQYGKTIDEKAFTTIREKYDYVYIGVGASKAYPLDVPGADAKGVYDQLEFLGGIRQGKSVETGKKIVVIGGGNSAMDACRAAKRLAGKSGKVTILYRRSIKEMPADLEEIDAVMAEGIEIQELVAPQSVMSKNGRVAGIKCHQMKLVQPDASGRPRPAVIEGSEFVTEADTIISAIGQQVIVPFLENREFTTDPKTYRTDMDKVYAGGDAIRGASTLIKAIADGRKAVNSILEDASLSGKIFFTCASRERDMDQLEKQLARRIYGPNLLGTDLLETDPLEINLAQRSGFDLVSRTMTKEMAIEEASRCLSCDTLCNICTTVCPNRANVSYKVEPFTTQTYKAIYKNGRSLVEKAGVFTISQAYQVINIGDFCNECGNCTSFCPSSGSPFLDKPKFYLSRSGFENENSGYCIEDHSIFKKKDGVQVSLTEDKKTYTYDSKTISARMDKESFKIIEARFKTQQDQAVDLTDAAELGFLYQSLKDFFAQ